MNAKPGILFVIAAPSGTGKTTLVNELIDTFGDLTVSISHTTRPKRPNETDGVNYHFVTKADFEKMLAHGDFLEHAVVFDNLYGTSKSWVDTTLAKGQDVILEIDWQGHQQIKALFPDAVSIFILPPSFAALRERLIARNQDKPAIIEKRLADVRKTLSHVSEFDYIVVNDEFEFATHELASIIEAARLAGSRQLRRHAKLISELGGA